MDRPIFDKNCGTIINSRYLTKREKPKKNEDSGYRKYIYFDKPPKTRSKKK